MSEAKEEKKSLLEMSDEGKILIKSEYYGN